MLFNLVQVLVWVQAITCTLLKRLHTLACGATIYQDISTDTLEWLYNWPEYWNWHLHSLT